MLTVQTDEEKGLFVCESCGCVHTKEDEVFHLGGVELCTDCANLISIDDPGCHFQCSECYGNCLLLSDAKPYVS